MEQLSHKLSKHTNTRKEVNLHPPRRNDRNLGAGVGTTARYHHNHMTDMADARAPCQNRHADPLIYGATTTATTTTATAAVWFRPGEVVWGLVWWWGLRAVTEMSWRGGAPAPITHAHTADGIYQSTTNHQTNNTPQKTPHTHSACDFNTL